MIETPRKKVKQNEHKRHLLRSDRASPSMRSESGTTRKITYRPKCMYNTWWCSTPDNRYNNLQKYKTLSLIKEQSDHFCITNRLMRDSHCRQKKRKKRKEVYLIHHCWGYIRCNIDKSVQSQCSTRPIMYNAYREPVW